MSDLPLKSRKSRRGCIAGAQSAIARPRLLAQAVRLGLALGAGAAAVPAHADLAPCPTITADYTFSGTDTQTTPCNVQAPAAPVATLAIDNVGSLTNDSSLSFGALGAGSIFGALTNSASGSLNNSGVLTVQSGGVLTNDGYLDNAPNTNAGSLNVYGTFNGKGSVNNQYSNGSNTYNGLFAVQQGGNANVANSPQLSGNSLTGGDWSVYAGLSGLGGTSASLSFGNGSDPIHVLDNYTHVLLVGAGAHIDQIGSNVATQLTDIKGESALFLEEQNFTNQVGNTLNVGVAGSPPQYGSLQAKYGTTTNAGTLNNYGLVLNSAMGIYSGGSGYVLGGGLFNNTGTMTNNGQLVNWKYGAFNNYGSLTNNGKLNNGKYGSTLTNAAGATLTNNGYIENSQYGTLNNAGILNNNYGGAVGTGVIINDATSTITNSGTLYNAGSATITNYGYIDNQAAGTVNNSGYLDNYGTIANAGSLNNSGYIGNGGALNNHGVIENDGFIGNWGTLDNSASLNNHWTLDNLSGGILNNNEGATLTNSGYLGNFGTLNNKSYATLNNQAGGVVHNEGGFYNNGGGTVRNYGAFHNFANGTVTNDGQFFNEAGAVTNDGNFHNNGVIHNAGDFIVSATGILDGTGDFIQTGGSVTVNGSLEQDSVDIQGGVLKGGGVITTHANSGLTIESGAFINPGNSPGILTLYSNFNLMGTMIAEIAGLATGTFDVVDVRTGTVTFGAGSQIDFDLTQWATQAAGQSWDFLLADSDFVDWSNLSYQVNGLAAGLSWRVLDLYKNGRYNLELELYSSVPEPGSLTLLGLGGALLVRFRRRPAEGRNTGRC